MKKFLQSGFTLVEMAVVLVILGLIFGGLFVPVSVQMDQLNYSETKQRMAEIKEALIGFTILNGRLPCPSMITDPTNTSFGEESSPCTSAEGYLPWKTLGVVEKDAWGQTQRTSAEAMVGYWRYRVDQNFLSTFDISTKPFGTVLKVLDSDGNTLTSTTEKPVAIFYSTGKNRTADGENANYEVINSVYQTDVESSTFDDHLLWISRPLLMNRMVVAGKLP